MSTKVDLKIMKEIYGDEILDILSDNIELVEKNINIIYELGFRNIEELLERHPLLFTNFTYQFKEKFEYLKKELGENYIDEIENDMSILEKIDV